MFKGYRHELGLGVANRWIGLNLDGVKMNWITIHPYKI